MNKGFLLLLLSICGNALGQDHRLTERTFNNTVSFSHPASWGYKERGDFITFMILSPMEYSNDSFRENINLIIDSSAGSKNIDLKSYVDSNIANLDKYVNKLQMDSVRLAEVNGLPAYGIYFSGFIPDNATPLRWVQYIMEAEKVKYVFTYTGGLNNSSLRSQAISILNSIKFARKDSSPQSKQ